MFAAPAALQWRTQLGAREGIIQQHVKRVVASGTVLVDSTVRSRPHVEWRGHGTVRNAPTDQRCNGHCMAGRLVGYWPALLILNPIAIPHAVPGQALDVRPLGDRVSTERTTALFKSHDLEVMRLVLLAGKSLPPHKVPGEITINCLEGSLDIDLEDTTVRLDAGGPLFLAGGATHGVKAITDASALVTLALKP